ASGLGRRAAACLCNVARATRSRAVGGHEASTVVTLLHISDLHFGLRRARRVAEAILRVEDDVRPHAVVCSGDLVEWSETDGPWRELRAFLDRLSKPKLVVPGNHDLE